MSSTLQFGVLTISDTCSVNANEDVSGPKLVSLIAHNFPNSEVKTAIVKDDVAEITSRLNAWISQSLHVIFTTGGTGFAPRDVTPEATKKVIQREAPGLALTMLMQSLQFTEMTALSRSVCGITEKSLIINFPGKLKAVIECFDCVKSLIPHAVALITEDNRFDLKSDHTPKRTLTPGVLEKSKVQMVASADRPRESAYPMIDLEEATNIILDNVPKIIESEVISVDDAIGRILFENVFSTDPLPPFRASIKDGYAICISTNYDTYNIVEQSIHAGDRIEGNLILKPTEAIRISTGAPVPDSANAVVQIEDTEVYERSAENKELKITLKIVPKLNQDIRAIGSDMPGNELILKADTLIDLGVIGILATTGRSTVRVYKNSSVGILSTGNELQKYNEPLKPFHIRDVNKINLKTLLKKQNFSAADCGIVKDNADDLKTAFDMAFALHDVVITTGGVSMGEYDLVKAVLTVDFGAKIHFGRVNMKPGNALKMCRKPATFATCMYNGKYKLIFALPGNPVSAIVCSYLFVIPALRAYATYDNVQLPKTTVIFDDESYKLDSRPEFVRARVVDGKARLLGNQISSRIGSMARANVLLGLPGANKEKTAILRGEELLGILID